MLATAVGICRGAMTVYLLLANTACHENDFERKSVVYFGLWSVKNDLPNSNIELIEILENLAIQKVRMPQTQPK